MPLTRAPGVGIRTALATVFHRSPARASQSPPPPPPSSSVSRRSGERARRIGASVVALLACSAMRSGADASGHGLGEYADRGDAYPGTATERMMNGRARAAALSARELDGDWSTTVRPALLRAAGLVDLGNVPPGQGNTQHCFNDFNHVDATTMTLEHSDNNNEGRVAGIAYNNPLGAGIRAARDPTMGEGGSWCTCILGSGQEPPRDVAHVQFKSKIAWKLVWVPGPKADFKSFVLVDDAGELLAKGTPTGSGMPSIAERRQNYEVVRGGRYAVEADRLSNGGLSEF